MSTATVEVVVEACLEFNSKIIEIISMRRTLWKCPNICKKDCDSHVCNGFREEKLVFNFVKMPRKSKILVDPEFVVGDYVFAKLRGYPFWPSQVSFSKQKIKYP